MEIEYFDSPQICDGQTKSLTEDVNPVDPEAKGRHRTMEHLALMREDGNSFITTPSLHSKKSFQSTLSKYTKSAINFTYMSE